MIKISRRAPNVKEWKKLGRRFKLTARNNVKSIFSSPGSSVGRALDFQTNVKGFESYVGRNSPFSQNWKQENIKTLSWPMRSRKNHSEPQNYRSLKNLGKRSFKIYQQETKWHASDRAPLAQSGERWTFNPMVRSSSPLWGKTHRFHKTRSRKI